MIYDPNSKKEKLTHEPQPPPSKHLQTTLAHLHGKDDAIFFAPDVTAEQVLSTFVGDLLQKGCEVFVPEETRVFDQVRNPQAIHRYSSLNG